MDNGHYMGMWISVNKTSSKFCPKSSLTRERKTKWIINWPWMIDRIGLSQEAERPTPASISITLGASPSIGEMHTYLSLCCCSAFSTPDSIPLTKEGGLGHCVGRPMLGSSQEDLRPNRFYQLTNWCSLSIWCNLDNLMQSGQFDQKKFQKIIKNKFQIWVYPMLWGQASVPPTRGLEHPNSAAILGIIYRI